MLYINKYLASVISSR